MCTCVRDGDCDVARAPTRRHRTSFGIARTYFGRDKNELKISGVGAAASRAECRISVGAADPPQHGTPPENDVTHNPRGCPAMAVRGTAQRALCSFG